MPLRQRQAACEHAQRQGLQHNVTGTYAGAPVFACVHLVDDGNVMRRYCVEGRHAGGARRAIDPHHFVDRRTIDQPQRIAITL